MFYYAATTLEIIEKSPVKKEFAPKVEAHEKAALTTEQAWKLWDALAGPETIRNRAFYGVLLFTGIRTGEALGLKWGDVDFVERKIHVRRAICRGGETTPKTKTSLRARPMSDQLFTALRNHRAMAHYTAAEDYVFASSTGRPANSDDLRTTLQKVLRDLKIALPSREDGLHLLRHTSGSLVFGATGSERGPGVAWSLFRARHPRHIRASAIKSRPDSGRNVHASGCAFFGRMDELKVRHRVRHHLPKMGRLAQLVRAPALQAGGRRFESCTAHQFSMQDVPGCLVTLLLNEHSRP